MQKECFKRSSITKYRLQPFFGSPQHRHIPSFKPQMLIESNQQSPIVGVFAVIANASEQSQQDRDETEREAQ
jgi:hypothetical protein